MRNNPVKQALAAGEPAFGTMIFEFFTPGIGQIVKAAGADFILFDMEHSGIDYRAGATKEKLAAANERTLVIALVETADGIHNVDEIAAVDGIDVVWLGHFDLTNFMGIPAEFRHPDYLAAVDRLVEAAKRHGKAAGMMAGDQDWGRDYMAKGFRAIAYGLDLSLFQRTLSEGLAALRSKPSPK